jgi:hypothetical protein
MSKFPNIYVCDLSFLHELYKLVYYQRKRTSQQKEGIHPLCTCGLGNAPIRVAAAYGKLHGRAALVKDGMWRA